MSIEKKLKAVAVYGNDKCIYIHIATYKQTNMQYGRRLQNVVSAAQCFLSLSQILSIFLSL